MHGISIYSCCSWQHFGVGCVTATAKQFLKTFCFFRQVHTVDVIYYSLTQGAGVLIKYALRLSKKFGEKDGHHQGSGIGSHSIKQLSVPVPWKQ